MLEPKPSPIVQIMHHPAKQLGVELYVKRDDLNHTLAQGNKIRKLAPIMLQIKEEGWAGILTFGGAFSNHLIAAAALAHEAKIKSVGIVRGTWADPHNPTLTAVRSLGMQLHFVSATDYALGMKSSVIEELAGMYPDYLVVPEGGYSPAAIKGCIGLGEELKSFILGKGWLQSETVIAIAAGTGGTATGVLEGLDETAHLLIIGPTKKGIDHAMIKNAQLLADLPARVGFSINTNYTFGGFGRAHPELMSFMRQFYLDTQIKPDPIYTGKVFYGVYNLLEKLERGETDTHSIRNGTKIIMVHTGGLQGWNGWKEQL